MAWALLLSELVLRSSSTQQPLIDYITAVLSLPVIPFWDFPAYPGTSQCLFMPILISMTSFLAFPPNLGSWHMPFTLLGTLSFWLIL